MDKELEHVCLEAYIARKTENKLVENNILTLQDLLQKSEILDSGRSPEKELLKVIAWYKWFQQTNQKDPEILKDFTAEGFEKFKENKDTFELPQECFPTVMRILKNDPAFIDHIRSSGRMSPFQQEEVENITNQLTPAMKKALEKFDKKGFTQEVVKATYSNLEEGSFPLVFVAGKTQVGKTSVKALAMFACKEVKVPTIIVAKGVQERQQIVGKLRHFVKGTSLENNVVNITEKKERLDTVLLENGAIVCNDTRPQIDKVVSHLKRYHETGGTRKKFMVIVDECDAVLCRTNKSTTLIEKACDELLKGARPCLTVMISATPVPVMIEVILRQKYYKSQDVAAYFCIEPSEEYHGFHDMVQLKDKDGKIVCLDQQELSYRNRYTSSCDKLLIEDALRAPTRKGVLLLDCTNPRVKAEGNVREKAEEVQKMCKEVFETDIVVMINIGGGIEVRPPGGSWEKKTRVDERKKGMDVHEVINEIDEVCGLGMPVFCYGFSKMHRCISYVSTNRTPTHIQVVLGKQHNIMNLAQTLGRGTGNWKSVLKRNGFDAVTVLTPVQDYDTVSKAMNYIDIVGARMERGENFHDAMTGANNAIPDGANFIRTNCRQISKIKRHRSQFEKNVAFERPPKELSQGELDAKNHFFDKAQHQRVLRTICDCSRDSYSEVNFEDIQEAFNDTFLDDQISIEKTDLKKILRDLVDRAVIRKAEDNDAQRTKGDTGWYRVEDRARLRQFINTEHAVTEFERTRGYSLEEVIGCDENAPDEASIGSSGDDESSFERDSDRRMNEDETDSSVAFSFTFNGNGSPDGGEHGQHGLGSGSDGRVVTFDSETDDELVAAKTKRPKNTHYQAGIWNSLE